MPFTVGDLAKLTGITVRTLHHYDEIGLVRPSERSAAGYRLYSDADVHRLQQVLLFRELGLPLEDIASAIDSGRGVDPAKRAALLREHREALLAKRARLDAMVSAVDAALGTLEKGHAMQPDDVKDMFDGFDPSQYEEEVKERWGNTDAYKESARRTKSYTKEQWQQLKDQAAEIYAALADLMRAGVAVTDARVQTLVEAHRAHIDRWFYPCSKELHKGLGAMYVADPRFAENLNKNGDGFAQYLSDAIAAS
ncbi:MAG TPA: MerR family transcriptional regulator [Kofleriaceae bacterium]|nr:MerR family transcriptional regulator [Kofleriaceae bacterium]